MRKIRKKKTQKKKLTENHTRRGVCKPSSIFHGLCALDALFRELGNRCVLKADLEDTPTSMYPGPSAILNPAHTLQRSFRLFFPTTTTTNRHPTVSSVDPFAKSHERDRSSSLSTEWFHLFCFTLQISTTSCFRSYNDSAEFVVVVIVVVIVVGSAAFERVLLRRRASFVVVIERFGNKVSSAST